MDPTSAELNLAFCRLLLAEAKKQARRCKVSIPKLKCYRYEFLPRDVRFEVWTDKELVWEDDEATNCYEAEANYIMSLLPDLHAVGEPPND